MTPMRRLFADDRWVALSLAAAAVGWCLVVAVLMTLFPLMRGGRSPSFLEALWIVTIPGGGALGGVWAAWNRRPVLLGLATAYVGLVTVVFGFSIGSAFTPSFGLLVWATFATVSAAPEPSASSRSNSADGPR